MLRDRIKTDTKNIHKYVENLPIMKQILESNITPQKYLNYLCQLKHIYRAIETNYYYEMLDWDFNLYQKCNHDIEELQKKFNLKTPEILPITQIYCDYLAKLTIIHISAHAYVRYMGDIYGGSIIKNKLDTEWSTTVYDIENKDTKKQQIIQFINELYCYDIFKSEVNSAFMSYASILQLC